MKMEERAAGGKEKKYVLYTVVGEEKERTGLGVWVVRILLGTLLLIALAVVPYVSLRLAQVNDRTLVVFQPVLVHNRSKSYNHPTQKSVHNAVTSGSQGSVSVTHILQSASLIKEGYNATTESSGRNTSPRQGNSTIITLHEATVTLSLLEDTSNLSRSANNSSIESPSNELSDEDIEMTEETNSTSSSSGSLMDGSGSEYILATSQVPAEPRNPKFIQLTKEISTENILNFSTLGSSTPPAPDDDTKEKTTIKNSSSDIVLGVKTLAISPKKAPASKSGITNPVTHKLAYVATASSGNHVGGICIWKTNKNITNWSFFFDNIPIEYQSHQDNVDHELRGMLVAVRLWSGMWHDYHVVLRSQNQAIDGSKHPTYQQLLSEIEEKSTNHFTYELEWRLRRDDSLVGIAFSLSRLYKDYAYWINEFQQRVEVIVGKQQWETAITTNRLFIQQNLFATPDMRSEKEIGDLRSLNLF